MTVTNRGTSNKNVSGNSETRRRRKRFLLETYRADVDVILVPAGPPGGEAADRLRSVGEQIGWSNVTFVTRLAGTGDHLGPELWTVPLGHGEIACRCFRCGRLLTFRTLEVDRIIPGCRGGKYVRGNIRPCCEADNKVLGNYERWGNAPSFAHHVSGSSNV